MGSVLEVTDRNGKIIYLTQERWTHIQQNHPEINLKDIEKTIMFPSAVIPSDRDKDVKWFFKQDKELRKYLFASIKYLNGNGFVITSHYTDNIP